MKNSLIRITDSVVGDHPVAATIIAAGFLLSMTQTSRFLNAPYHLLDNTEEDVNTHYTVANAHTVRSDSAGLDYIFNFANETLTVRDVAQGAFSSDISVSTKTFSELDNPYRAEEVQQIGCRIVERFKETPLPDGWLEEVFFLEGRYDEKLRIANDFEDYNC